MTTEFKMVPVELLRRAADRLSDLGQSHISEPMFALLLSAPASPQAAQPIPDYFVEACDKFDWTPDEALRFYAEGKHFDTAEGRTRILCTGAIASYALKNSNSEHAEMKGVELPKAVQPVAYVHTMHYEADGHSGNVTLCGQTDWLGQPVPAFDTDRLVDCTACISIVKFVESHNFKGTACR